MFNRKQKFSIRKFTVGVVSVCLGFSFVEANRSLVKAEEVISYVRHEEADTLEYNYLSYDELTDEQKKAIIEGTPEDIKQSDQVYYFVYKPISKESHTLPKTGISDDLAYLVSGLGILVLAVGVSKHKKKAMSSLVVLSLVGTAVAYPIEVFASNGLLVNYNKQVSVENGSLENAIIDIPGYRYFGYFLVNKGKSSENIKQSANKELENTSQNNTQKRVSNSSVIENSPAKALSTEEKEIVSNDAPVVELPTSEIPDVSVVPDSAPVVELPVAEIATVPNDAPVVELPTSEIPDVSVVPDSAPVVELPVSEIATVPNDAPVVELPTSEIPDVSVVPDSAPVVELPVAEIATVPNDAPVVELAVSEIPDVSVVPDSAPVVELPVSEIATVPNDAPVVELPTSEIPDVSVVPDSAPVVEFPVSEIATVPNDAPVVELAVSEIPDVSVVPDNAPVVELPVAEIATVSNDAPVVELPTSEIPDVSVVPDNAPVVELPVAEIATVSNDAPVVELPTSEIPDVSVVPDSAPIVELPVAEITTEDVTRTVETPQTSETIQDSTIYEGESRQEHGRPKIETVLDRITRVNGEDVKREEVSRTTTQEMVTDKTYVGTKPAVEAVGSSVRTELPVAEITTEDVTRTVTTPQTSETLQDATMYEGESRQEQGRPKIETVLDRITRVNGEEVKREEVSRATTQEMVTDKTYVGTKPAVEAVGSSVRTELPVAEITTEDVTRTIETPQTSETIEDPTMYEGESRQEQGRPKIETVLDRITRVNGKEEKREEVSRTTTQEMVTNKTYVGTKEKVVLTDKKIEFKSVSEAYLYKLDENKNMVKVLQLDAVPSDLSNYHININLENDKSVWLPVSEIVANDNQFTVKANLAEHVQFDTSETMSDTYNIKVAKTVAEAGTFTSFKNLIDAIKENPSGTFILGSDLTATEVYKKPTESSYLSDVKFSGTLKSKEGSVFTIYDLKKSLFKNAENATISNINLGKVDINDTVPTSVGALAQEIHSTTVENVSAEGNVFGRQMVGGLIGVADHDSKLDNTSFVGKISSANSLGGLAGLVTRGSQVTNSFADINGSSSLLSSDKMGGLVAELHMDSSVTNSYAKGTIANYGAGDAAVGGLIGGVYGGIGSVADKGKVENNVSLVNVVNGKAFIGNLNPVLANEKTIANNVIVDTIHQDDITRNYRLNAISKAEAEAKTSTMVNRTASAATITNSVNKPFNAVAEYRSTYDKLYNNLQKLMPFYDRYTIVKEANKLAEGHKLNTTEIKNVIPYINNQIATNYFNNKENINKIKVVYKSGQSEFLTISNPEEFKNTGVIDYNVEGLGVKYHLNQFVKDNSSLINHIVGLLANKSYVPEVFNPANLMEWEESARQPKIEKLYLKESFNNVKSEMNRVVAGLLDNTAIGDYSTGNLKAYMEKYLDDNQNALLVGSSYLNRWYDFANTRDELLFALTNYDRDNDALELVTKIGNESIDSLKSFSTQTTYNQILGHYTGFAELVDYIKNRYEATKSGEESINDWIKKNTQAYLVTRDSKSKPEVKGDIFARLSKLEFQNMLLPLLNIKEKNVYGIVSSNSMAFGIYDSYLEGATKNSYNYNQKMAEIDKKIDDTADAIQRYFDALYRILNEQSVAKLVKTNIQVFDATKKGKYSYNWSPEFGDAAFDSVKAFIAPIGRWQSYSGSSAYAPVLVNSELVYFAQGDLLSDGGWSTLTHEHMHNLDDKVILNGHRKRFGHGPESYARGMFQSPPLNGDTFGMNLIYEIPKSQQSIAYHNYSPDRFQTMQDFETYMRRVFDVIYTLEAAEADAMSQLGLPTIKNNYNVLKAISSGPEHQIDRIVNIGTALDGKPLNLETFVNEGLVSKRISSNRDYGLNDYISVNMFDSQFGINENPNGVSGGLTFRRVAFELLAEKGYYEGMVPYISNQYVDESFKETGHSASDTFILNKIFNGQYKSFKEFRIEMLKQRKEKANDLISFGSKLYYPINSYNDIVKEFKQKIQQNDMSGLNYTKDSIYRALLQSTNEFRDSIYQNGD